MAETAPHRVVIVGGGFGGLQAAIKLRRADVHVTLIDRRNFHLFQPLLYQVATASLATSEIAWPIRHLFRRRGDVTTLLAEVTGIDTSLREVALSTGEVLHYDTLVIATGATHAYFGHDDWEPYAPGLKTLEDALELRRRILSAFEAAEIEPDPDLQRQYLTFVVVGGGPTGVELAGQIAEIARDTVKRDFRKIDPRTARIVLVEGADRVLLAFPERLSEKGKEQLEKLGVTVRLDRLVTGVDEEGVTLAVPGGGTERLESQTIVWAAGVAASPLAAILGRATGADVDRAGRVTVLPDLTLPGHPEIMVLGDMTRVSDGHGGLIPLPGVAPAAMQMGRYAAKVVKARLAGKEPPGPFRYRDKGNLATIGRMKAVGLIKGVQLTGLFAWLGWLTIHLFYLTGLQNRILVLIRWTVSFITHGRGARLITGEAPGEDGMPE